MREVNTGFGDGLAAAFEMVVTPVLFGFFGLLLDRWLGTKPVFMLGFALIVFAYMMWKMGAKYNAEMDSHMAKGAWRAHPGANPSPRAGSANPTDSTEAPPSEPSGA